MLRPSRFGTPAFWEVAALALLIISSAVLAVAYAHWPASGLAARTGNNPRWEGSPAPLAGATRRPGDTRQAPFAGARPDRQRRVDGILAVEQAGRYAFDITSNGRFWLWIDKTLVASDEGWHFDAGASGGAITLTTGSHPITITYAGRSGPAALAVVSTGPDGVPSALETRSLAPSAAAARRGWWRRILNAIFRWDWRRVGPC